MGKKLQRDLFKDIAEATKETLGEIGYRNTIVVGATDYGEMAQYISGNYRDIAHMITILLLNLPGKTEEILEQILDDLENFEFERDTGDH